MGNAANPANALPANVACEHWSKPVPPHKRTVSWRSSMPRSNRKSSKFRNDSGNRTDNITTRRITSGDELKQQNGLGGFALNLRFMHDHYQRWARRDALV